MSAFFLYVRLVRYGFRRHATYWGAAAAGALTNTVFGVLRAYVLIALWESRPGLGGYDVGDAVTFCFLTQAFIGPMQLFGAGLELSRRIRSGDIALDLVRPAPLQMWTLAEDLGRAAYLFLARGLPPTLTGALLFGIEPPADAAAFLVCLVLAVVVGFGWRYLIAMAACWVLDDRGLNVMSAVLTTFFSGMMLPLVIFPGRLGSLARSLPWAAMVQVPADVYLGGIGDRTGGLAGALAFQCLWAAVLLGLGAALTAAARRKVVIQGG
ncbi:ABC transporter permease [Sphaerimonospora sp. CA-214678]|uniref:ABC transporter permease n=1 Tax=Sphaerimonospora sp. CA-214678 TaxID=3240029 RepID=UPI003D8FCACE